MNKLANIELAIISENFDEMSSLFLHALCCELNISEEEAIILLYQLSKELLKKITTKYLAKQ